MSDETNTLPAPAAVAPVAAPGAAAPAPVAPPAAVPAIPVLTPPVAVPAPAVVPATNPEIAPEVQEQAVDAFTEKYILNVATNVAHLDFPRDPFGFTSAFKKAALQAASSIRGQDDKHLIFVNTLRILIAHVEARKAGDVIARAAILAQRDAISAESQKRERYQAQTTDTLPE